MNKEQFIASGLIEKYILGLTSEEEDRIVERFMESDTVIKARIFQNTDNLQQKTKLKAAGNKTQWIQYAVIVILSAISLYTWNSNRTINNANDILTAQLSNCNTSFAAIDKEKATLTSNELILTHSATEKVRLKGTNLAPEANMLAFYNPIAEVLMIKIDKLRPLPNGKYYHMWADVEGKMIHVGSLSNDALNLTSLSFVSKAESLNVTIEDKPVTKHPNVSQLALSGKLQ